MNRWVVYQRERFPLAAHAPLVAAFSASAVCFSSLLRGHVAAPRPAALVVAFVTSLLFFLQLRIADEFKDFEEDSRFRPYRPVPRGLVTLRELAWIGVAAAVVQLGLALWLDAAARVAAGAVVDLVSRLMTREFFVPRWLRAHPIVYMASHMLILPLIDLYATACDWRVAGERTAPVGLPGSWSSATSTASSSRSAGRRARRPTKSTASRPTARCGARKAPPARGSWLFWLTGCGRLGGIGRASARRRRAGDAGRARRHVRRGGAGGSCETPSRGRAASRSRSWPASGRC